MRTNEERITQGIEQKVRALGGSVKAGPRVISHGELTPSRERICVSGRQLREVGGATLAELVKANVPPKIFNRSGVLSRIHYLSDKLGERHAIASFNISSLRGAISEASDFYRVSSTGKSSDCSPPKDLAEHIFNLPPEQWGFPPLLSIIEAPTLRPSGTVLTEPGYDAETQVFYSPTGGFTMPPVREVPSGEDLERARAIIDEVLCDFPFVDGASRATAIATTITAVIRSAIDGPVPLALFDSVQAGSGKSLLGDVIAILATGRAAAMRSFPFDENEIRKQLTSGLLEGPALWVYDNVDRPMNSGELCKVITASIHADRVLQHTRDLHLPVRSTWIATGNNFRLGGDLPRRCYWAKLDPKCSRPQDRKGPHLDKRWRYADLRRHVLEHRGEILWAILTLARNWFALGGPAPQTSPVLGGFEEWSTKLGGILESAGIGNFLANTAEMHRAADAESEEWESFLSEIHSIYNGEFFTTAELAARIENREPRLIDVLPESVTARRDRDIKTVLGNLFRKRLGRRFGDSQIHLTTANRKRNNAMLWRVVVDEESN